jgi:hypothetical protein
MGEGKDSRTELNSHVHCTDSTLQRLDPCIYWPRSREFPSRLVEEAAYLCVSQLKQHSGETKRTVQENVYTNIFFTEGGGVIDSPGGNR